MLSVSSHTFCLAAEQEHHFCSLSLFSTFYGTIDDFFPLLSTITPGLSTQSGQLSTFFILEKISMPPGQLLTGFILAIAISVSAWKAGALSISGASAAVIIGLLIFGLGGLRWAVLLLVFFISSSLLSRFFKNQKRRLEANYSKGEKRDWGQVAANGGLGAALVIVHTFFPENQLVWPAFAGAMAAVNADTWATELGVLSLKKPRLITTLKPVERGSSGGVSAAGFLAAAAGAGLVGIAAVIYSDASHLLVFLIVLIGGFTGSLVDSFFGATLQSIYYCQECNKETERHPIHICGFQTTRLRGIPIFNNDVVNFTCSITGAVVSSGLAYLLIY
jgi:uncharacterized protein (TIGR00297 family)